MKKSIIGFILLVAAFTVNAQDKKFQLAAGPVVSIPTGELESINTVGFGAELVATYNLSDSFQGFAQTGVQFFGGKTLNSGIGSIKMPSFTHIPVLVGARYLIDKFNVGLGAGYGSFSLDGSKSNGFSVSPQVGVNLGKIDLTGHYTSTSVSNGSLNYFGLKTAYKF
jgi:hypothetical protein